MATIQSIRGGRDNDPDFHTRMRGQGPWAELLRTRFKIAARRYGLDKDYSRAARPVPAAGRGTGGIVLGLVSRKRTGRKRPHCGRPIFMALFAYELDSDSRLRRYHGASRSPSRANCHNIIATCSRRTSVKRRSADSCRVVSSDLFCAASVALYSGAPAYQGPFVGSRSLRSLRDTCLWIGHLAVLRNDGYRR